MKNNLLYTKIEEAVNKFIKSETFENINDIILNLKRFVLPIIGKIPMYIIVKSNTSDDVIDKSKLTVYLSYDLATADCEKYNKESDDKFIVLKI
jgi:hypothetical protein